MSRHIKFPLFMKDDVPVRTMEEFREYFDLEKMLYDFVSGRLATWLKDRYYDELAEKVSELDKRNNNSIETLCKLFEIEKSEYNAENLNLQDIEKTITNKLKVKAITSREDAIDNPNSVVFSQEDLDRLLSDTKISEIFVYGTEFCPKIVNRKIKFTGIGEKKTILNFKNYSIIEAKYFGYTFENIEIESDSLKELKANKAVPVNIFDNLFNIAFNDNELNILLDDINISKIYLYKGKYTLKLKSHPVEIEGIEEVSLNSDDVFQTEYEKAGYTFVNVGLPTKFNFSNKDVTDGFIFGYYNGKPLQWIILEKNKESIRAITRYVIEQRIYSKYYSGWENSSLKHWLNYGFYDTAFSDEEKERIDEVTILSKQEVLQTWHLDSEKEWWTKTPVNGRYGSYIYIVQLNGEISERNNRPMEIPCGVRPVITITI